jgi:hypothetical protein
MTEVDLTYKQFDTYPPIKTTLEQESATEPGKIEIIDLTNALKVTTLLKPPKGLIEVPCTGWAATTVKNNKGQVEFPLGQQTFKETGLYELEFEIEWPEKEVEYEVGKKGFVKEFQTIPNGNYHGILVVADLGTA